MLFSFVPEGRVGYASLNISGLVRAKMIRYFCLLMVFVTLGVAGSNQVIEIFNIKFPMVPNIPTGFKFYKYKDKNMSWSWSCGLTAPNVKSTGNNKKLMKCRRYHTA